MRITSFILSFWLTLFTALPTVYGMACLQPQSSTQSCCVDHKEGKETNRCCDENSQGTCSYCNSVYLAVLTSVEEKELDVFFTERVDYPKKDNSFLSSYLNVPFHPPKFI